MERIAKPFGKSLILIENPISILGPSEKKMFDSKMGILETAADLDTFPSAPNLKQLTDRITMITKQLFPNAGSILLAKKGADYLVVSNQDIEFDPGKLNLSATNSLVKIAGEVESLYRRTIYLPDLEQPLIYLASKFDQVTRGGGFYPNQHEIEEGTIEESGLKIDLVSLKRCNLKAIAAAPILEFQHTDPIGALVLVGEPSFLNPYFDLIILRELADQIAKPLKSRIG